MASVTIPLGDATLAQSTFIYWYLAAGHDVTALSPDGTTRLFTLIQFTDSSSNSNQALDIVTDAATYAFGNLSTAWQDFDQAILIEAGGLTLDLPGPNFLENPTRDTTSRYNFVPTAAKEAEIDAFIAAYQNLSQSQKDGTTLTLRDEIPGAGIVVKERWSFIIPRAGGEVPPDRRISSTITLGDASLLVTSGANKRIEWEKDPYFEPSLDDLSPQDETENLYIKNLILSDGSVRNQLDATTDIVESWGEFYSAILISAGGLTLEFPGPDYAGNTSRDDDDIYWWRTGDAQNELETSEFIDSYSALPQAEKDATTLTLRNSIPPTGRITVDAEDINWSFGTLTPISVRAAPVNFSFYAHRVRSTGGLREVSITIPLGRATDSTRTRVSWTPSPSGDVSELSPDGDSRSVTSVTIRSGRGIPSEIRITGGDLLPSWETFSSAIVIEASGGRIVLPGPNFSGNARRDPTSPYSFELPLVRSGDTGDFVRDVYSRGTNATLTLRNFAEPEPPISRAARPISWSFDVLPAGIPEGILVDAERTTFDFRLLDIDISVEPSATQPFTGYGFRLYSSIERAYGPSFITWDVGGALIPSHLQTHPLSADSRFYIYAGRVTIRSDDQDWEMEFSYDHRSQTGGELVETWENYRSSILFQTGDRKFSLEIPGPNNLANQTRDNTNIYRWRPPAYKVRQAAELLRAYRDQPLVPADDPQRVLWVTLRDHVTYTADDLVRWSFTTPQAQVSNTSVEVPANDVNWLFETPPVGFPYEVQAEDINWLFDVLPSGIPEVTVVDLDVNWGLDTAPVRLRAAVTIPIGKGIVSTRIAHGVEEDRRIRFANFFDADMRTFADLEDVSALAPIGEERGWGTLLISSRDHDSDFLVFDPRPSPFFPRPRDGHDLIDSWEDFESAFLIRVGDLILDLPGPNYVDNEIRDSTEEYDWRIPADRRADVEAFITAYENLSEEVQETATLTLRDDYERTSIDIVDSWSFNTPVVARSNTNIGVDVEVDWSFNTPQLNLPIVVDAEPVNWTFRLRQSEPALSVFVAGEGEVSTDGNSITWELDTPLPDISELAPPGELRYFHRLHLTSEGATFAAFDVNHNTLSLNDAPTWPGGVVISGGDHDLIDNWETFGTGIVIEAGPLMLEVSSPDYPQNLRRDDSELYGWVSPFERLNEIDTFIELYQELPQQQRDETRIVFRNFIVVPLRKDAAPANWEFNTAQAGVSINDVIVDAAPAIWSFEAAEAQLPIREVVSQTEWEFNVPEAIGRTFTVDVPAESTNWEFSTPQAIPVISVNVSVGWEFSTPEAMLPGRVNAEPTNWEFTVPITDVHTILAVNASASWEFTVPQARTVKEFIEVASTSNWEFNVLPATTFGVRYEEVEVRFVASPSPLIVRKQGVNQDDLTEAELVPDHEAVMIDVQHNNIKLEQLESIRRFVSDSRIKRLAIGADDGLQYRCVFGSKVVSFSKNNAVYDAKVTLFGNPV